MLLKIKSCDRIESLAFWGILFAIFLFFLWVLYGAEGFIGDADSVTHYRFSRYSWQFPAFLLDHWAKPVFTLLSSPFAQFGHSGVQVFNLFGGIASAWLAWLSARRLGYENRLLMPLLVFFAPIYTVLVVSGQIEVLFGLFIIATSWLCLSKNYFWAAIVISFSHLVRTEGIFLIPVFAMHFIIKKQYTYIPLLLFGTLIYSIIGFFHFKDFFWLFTQMPYLGKAEAYGTGNFFHFFQAWPKIFGIVNALLVPLGIAAIMVDWFRSREGRRYDELGLFVLPFLVYFMAHVLMWQTGIGRSLGMYRYMVSIVPVGALLSLRGFNTILLAFRGIDRSNISGIAAGLIIITLFMISPFQHWRIPQKLDGMNKVMKQASDYILEQNLNQNKIFILTLLLNYILT